jgi:hypothetical protein
MKKIFLFLAVAGITLLSSCEGPEGPAGYSAEATVYELLPITFQAPGFGVIYTYPQATSASDHALVYRLSGSDPVTGARVWQLIPQSKYFVDGTFNFAYNYDATQYDVNIYLEGEDLETLNAEWRENQIFRVVIIPGQLSQSKSSIDTTNYYAVVNAYNIHEKDVRRNVHALNK